MNMLTVTLSILTEAENLILITFPILFHLIWITFLHSILKYISPCSNKHFTLHLLQ